MQPSSLATVRGGDPLAFCPSTAATASTASTATRSLGGGDEGTPPAPDPTTGAGTMTVIRLDPHTATNPRAEPGTAPGTAPGAAPGAADRQAIHGAGRGSARRGCPPTRHQSGLTLIELAVVMLILIGLATLVLPMIGGIVTTTHHATGAATSAELINQIQLYQAQKNSLPNGWDLLTDAGGAPLNYLDNSGYRGALTSANFTVFPDPGGQIHKSLAAAGITTGGFGTQANEVTLEDGSYALCTGAAQGLTQVSPATCGQPQDATYKSFTLPPTPIVAGTRLVTAAQDGTGQAILTALRSNSRLGSGALAGYDGVIVLGIGQNSQMVGTVMQAAPTHFPDNASIVPNIVYSRFLAAFAVDSSGNKAARLIGIVHAVDQGGWESLYTDVSAANR